MNLVAGVTTFPVPARFDVSLTRSEALGARGQLPSGSMLSTWRVLKQFAQLLPNG